jgi:hypothetical protein
MVQGVGSSGKAVVAMKANEIGQWLRQQHAGNTLASATTAKSCPVMTSCCGRAQLRSADGQPSRWSIYTGSI